MKKIGPSQSVSIVIPNWNGVYLLKKNLQKILDSSPGVEIIITDDASTDGSVEYIQKNFPQVNIIRRARREGFASNVNAGVAKTTGDIVVLLNTDVVPEKGFLEPLVSHFKDPNIFAVGCLEKSEENGKIILRGRGLATWKKGFFVHSRGEVNTTTTAWVSGGSGAFRKTIWNTLGGMDALYNPFYWEDIDLSYRARKAGWEIIFEPKSIVNHYHEEGKIKREFTSNNVKRIAYRNQFIFIWKNMSDPSIIIGHIFWTPIRMIQAILSGDFQMLHGYFEALLLFPKIVQSRLHQSSYWKKSDSDLMVV